MLMHSLMDESERFLLAPYQRLNAISLLSDIGDSESDDPAYSKIPKMLSNAKIKEEHKLIVDKFFVSALNLRYLKFSNMLILNILHKIVTSQSFKMFIGEIFKRNSHRKRCKSLEWNHFNKRVE